MTRTRSVLDRNDTPSIYECFPQEFPIRICFASDRPCRSSAISPTSSTRTRAGAPLETSPVRNALPPSLPLPLSTKTLLVLVTRDFPPPPPLCGLALWPQPCRGGRRRRDASARRHRRGLRVGRARSLRVLRRWRRSVRRLASSNGVRRGGSPLDGRGEKANNQLVTWRRTASSPRRASPKPKPRPARPTTGGRAREEGGSPRPPPWPTP